MRAKECKLNSGNDIALLELVQKHIFYLAGFELSEASGLESGSLPLRHSHRPKIVKPSNVD